MDKVILIPDGTESFKGRYKTPERVERALEIMELETEGDYKGLIEKHEEALDDIKLGHDSMIDEHLKELDRIESRHQQVLSEYRDTLEDFTDDYSEFVDSHESEIGGLRARRGGIVEEYSAVLDEVRREYRELLGDHIDSLEMLSAEKRSNAIYSFLTGSLLLGIGLAAAASYRATQGVFDFYTQMPEVYGNDPLMAVPTLAFPVAGAYILKSSYSQAGEYRDLNEEINELKKLRLEDGIDESGRSR